MQNPEQLALHRALQDLCQYRRDPANPRVGPQQVVNALNLCLAVDNRFDINRYGCAMEFLDQLFANLALAPGYLISHLEQGLCDGCGQQAQQVVDTH